MTRGSPHSPRRQRRALYTADSFERRHRMSVPLSRDLRNRFHRRSVPLRKGDTVRVLAGSFKGREERVARINRRDYSVTLDNVTLKTADEKLKPLDLRAGRLVITRLNLSDAWRRRSLRVREEDVTPEERGETPPEEEELPEEAATPVEAPKTEAEQSPEAPPAPEESTPSPEDSVPATRPKRRPKAEPAEEEA
jgi:ribosomal protein uL24